MSNLQASNDSFKYDDLKHAVETIDREIETLEILKNNLDGNLSKALDLLQNTKGRVIVTGMGKPEKWRRPLLQPERFLSLYTRQKQAMAI